MISVFDLSQKDKRKKTFMMYNAMSTYNKSSGVIGTDVILFAVKGQGSVVAVVRDVDSLRVFRQLATGRTNMTDALGFGSKFTLFCTPWPEAIQLASGSGQTMQRSPEAILSPPVII